MGALGDSLLFLKKTLKKTNTKLHTEITAFFLYDVKRNFFIILRLICNFFYIVLIVFFSFYILFDFINFKAVFLVIGKQVLFYGIIYIKNKILV